MGRPSIKLVADSEVADEVRSRRGPGATLLWPPSSASATAEERSRLLSLSRKDFYEIIRKEPQLSTKLLWAFTQVLADRLRKTTAELSGARLEAGAEDLTADALFEES